MRCADFVRLALCIEVVPSMRGGRKCLVPADSSGETYARLLLEIAQLAPPTVTAVDHWAAEQVEALLQINFADDVWHTVTPTGLPVVLVKQNAMQGRLSTEDVLRRVHIDQITHALTQGITVTAPVLEDYRMQVDAISAATAREGYC
jgi:hypothetical protein